MVGELWPHVRRMVCASFEKSDLGRASDLDTEVISGRALLWIIHDIGEIACALVTRLETTDKGRVCAILAIGGNGSKRWLPLIAGIEKYAITEDCHCVRFIGRKGWKRVLPEYREVGVVMERRIDG